MREIPKLKITKIIATLLSILMLWQGVVWANPDIFRKNNLQARSLITSPDRVDSFLMMTTGYLGYHLTNLERDPARRNVIMMLKGVKEEFASVANNEKIDEKYRQAVQMILDDLDQTSRSGEFIIDAGTYKVRYYNPNIYGADPAGSSFAEKDPGAGYQVTDEKKIGKYLSRQILTRKALPEPASQTSHPRKTVEPFTGEIARGNAEELREAFLKRKEHIKPMKIFSAYSRSWTMRQLIK
ncbi:MAG: hypothetical protein WBC99_00165, partial [Candidatus Omnitrophota bacterium]